MLALLLLLPAGLVGQSADPADTEDWRRPPLPSDMPPVPGLEGAVPSVEAYLPGSELDRSALPEAVPRETLRLEDGDTLRLLATPVRRTIRGRELVLFGFNRQVPGPLIRVGQGSQIIVVFSNYLPDPTTVHWHGIRIENRFDGVPEVTQEPVEPDARFVYRVRFPDPGVYWYHPHLREDIQQDLGLAGNLLVEAEDPDHYGPTNRDEILMLDDLLVDDAGLLPFGREGANHALMGRFGNVLLVNGRPDYRLEVRRGEVVRFHLTNASNTRTFNLVFGDEKSKVLAADVSRFEREQWTESVMMGPAQRYVVDVRFDEPGTAAITNRIQAVNHFLGEFEARVDTLGLVTVRDEPVEPDHGASFDTLREHPTVLGEVDSLRRHLDRPPDRRLDLSVEVEGLPPGLMRIMALDTAYAPPVEMNDAMPMMNWLSTTREVRWILRDPATGRENDEIDWTFRTGERVKLRLHNNPRSFHPMQHPIHLHGQRFLVLARDGEPNDNFAWKDTAIVPVGSTVDLLVEFSNPGEWMLHCHISEHLEAGMMTTFHVEGETTIR